jgi:amino acid transporter
VHVGGSRSGGVAPSSDRSGDDDEQPEERQNRELIELLNELRVALPGVQVLFAFLLTVPFSNRFPTLTGSQRAIYFATFVGTTIATGLFMAPTAYHRIRFRQGDKERMLRTSNRFAIVGIAFLALSVTSAVVLTTDLMFGLGTASLVGLGVLLFLVWVWFAIPLARRLRDEEGGG